MMPYRVPIISIVAIIAPTHRNSVAKSHIPIKILASTYYAAIMSYTQQTLFQKQKFFSNNTTIVNIEENSTIADIDKNIVNERLVYIPLNSKYRRTMQIAKV